MSLEDAGKAKTRKGISKASETQIDGDVDLIITLDGDRYEFASTKMYRNESKCVVEGYHENDDDIFPTGGKWSATIAKCYNATVNSIYATNGSMYRRISGIDYQATIWGMEPPALAPIVTITSPNPDTGQVYGVKYTYCRKVDGVIEYESNPSPSANVGSWYIDIIITSFAYNSVTHWRVYRTLGDGTDYYWCEDIPITDPRWPTGYPIARTDANLGTLVEEDHDPPPEGGTVVFGPEFNNTLFLLVDTKLYWSKPNLPEYWPPENYLEVSKGEDLVAGGILNGMVYVASIGDIFQMQGTGSSSFFTFPTNTNIGSVNHRSFVSSVGKGIVHLARDGLYLFSGNNDDRITYSRLNPIFFDTDVGLIKALDKSQIDDCWARIYHNKIWFAYPDVSSAKTCNVLTIDLKDGKTEYYTYPMGLVSSCYDPVNGRILAAGSDGYVYVIDDPDQTDDDGEPIDWTIKSKEFGNLRKYFPRWARYDLSLEGGATATSSIMLDDDTAQSHVFTSSRQTKKRLIATSAGDRLAIKISGTGTAVVRSVEVE
jgi:hypothetical protein